MSATRDFILSQIRLNKPEGSLEPDMELIKGFDLYGIQEFINNLRSVNAEVTEVASYEEAINEIFVIGEDFNRASLLEGVANCDCEDNFIVDTLVARGEFGVAENGAIWVTEANVPSRQVLFSADKVILILSKDSIVGNMHQAMGKINLASQGYGVFVAGPSKTADIEQSLVIGAHGPKSLWVVMY